MNDCARNIAAELAGESAAQCTPSFPGLKVEQAVGGGLHPFQVTRAQLISVFNSQKLVARLIHAGWIETVRRGKPGREGLYDFRSAELAYQRLRNGDDPPLLPCERKVTAPPK